jgi:electron transfer flavoprotein alpha/beta subunit
MGMPHIPVLAARQPAVVTVDEDEINRWTTPLTADILAAGDVPADARTAGADATPYG